MDYFDLKERVYDFPRISSISSGGKRWMVVTMWPHCGTGCSLHHTDWFELSGGKIRKVLRVPDSGHDANVNPGISYETRFVSARQSGKSTVLEFIYHLTVTAGFRSNVDTDLWEEEKIIRFVQPAQDAVFLFAANGSELSQEFVESVFGLYYAELSQLYRLFEEKLLEIGRNVADKRRFWLKDLLDQNPNLPELAAVRKAYLEAR